MKNINTSKNPVNIKKKQYKNKNNKNIEKLNKNIKFAKFISLKSYSFLNIIIQKQ